MKKFERWLSLLGLYALLTSPAWATRSPAKNAGPRLQLRGTFYSGALNINTATASELCRLPGLGRATAEAVLYLRQQRGSFRRLEELLEVSGIGPKKLEKLRPYLKTFGPSDFQATGKERRRTRDRL